MRENHSFNVGSVGIGSSPGLFLIAGPCVIESEDHALKMAESISAITRRLRLPYIFKASYDKANRTSLKSFRGPGLHSGLRILQKVKETTGIPVLTDVHEAVDVPQVAEVADVAGVLGVHQLQRPQRHVVRRPVLARRLFTAPQQAAHGRPARHLVPEGQRPLALVGLHLHHRHRRRR